MYTDGVSDNIKPEDLKICIQEQIKEGKIISISQAADCLARTAHFLGKDPSHQSPFLVEQEAALKRGERVGDYPAVFIGGKEDDVTVTIAQIFFKTKHPNADDPVKSLVANDKHFTIQKTVYTSLLTPKTELEKQAHARALEALTRPPMKYFRSGNKKKRRRQKRAIKRKLREID